MQASAWVAHLLDAIGGRRLLSTRSRYTRGFASCSIAPTVMSSAVFRSELHIVSHHAPFARVALRPSTVIVPALMRVLTRDGFGLAGHSAASKLVRQQRQPRLVKVLHRHYPIVEVLIA